MSAFYFNLIVNTMGIGRGPSSMDVLTQCLALVDTVTGLPTSSPSWFTRFQNHEESPSNAEEDRVDDKRHTIRARYIVYSAWKLEREKNSIKWRKVGIRRWKDDLLYIDCVNYRSSTSQTELCGPFPFYLNII